MLDRPLESHVLVFCVVLEPLENQMSAYRPLWYSKAMTDLKRFLYSISHLTLLNRFPGDKLFISTEFISPLYISKTKTIRIYTQVETQPRAYETMCLKAE